MQSGFPTLPEPPSSVYEPDRDGADRFGWRPAEPPEKPKLPRQSFVKRRLAPIGAALLAFLAKVKSIILLVPKAKLLVTAGTMLVSIAAYTTIWGATFALGFVILLLVHEMGHVIALRREGIKASPPMFIPFLGAVISARSLGDNAAAEARVGLAGPLLGTLGAAVCLLIWHLTGHTFWEALAFTGFFLNLFNLLPVVPLDGGRAMAAMTPWFWFAGLIGMVVLAIVFPNPIILIIVVLAAFETYKRWKLRRTGSLEQLAYYRVRPRDRWLVAAVYLSLVALLVVGMDATHLARTLG
jgi:Zn-dependent protease